MSDTRQTARDQRAADDANAAQTQGEPKQTAAEARDAKAADAAAAADPAAQEAAKAQAEEDARIKAEADAAAKAEATKAKAAKDGTTGDPSGNPAGVAFSQRIADAKFTLRNQGHTEIEALLDDMHAGLQRLEAKFTT